MTTMISTTINFTDRLFFVSLGSFFPLLFWFFIPPFPRIFLFDSGGAHVCVCMYVGVCMLSVEQKGYIYQRILFFFVNQPSFFGERYIYTKIHRGN